MVLNRSRRWRSGRPSRSTAGRLSARTTSVVRQSGFAGVSRRPTASRRASSTSTPPPRWRTRENRWRRRRRSSRMRHTLRRESLRERRRVMWVDFFDGVFNNEGISFRLFESDHKLSGRRQRSRRVLGEIYPCATIHFRKFSLQADTTYAVDSICISWCVTFFMVCVILVLRVRFL